MLLSKHTREESVVGRYGGDEFVIVLPNCDEEVARHVGERLLQVLAESPCPAGEGWPAIQASLSIGVACVTSGETCSAQELIDRADQSMYLAKGSPRDDIIGRIDHAA